MWIDGHGHSIEDQESNGKSKEPVAEVHCFKCDKSIRSDDTSGIGYTKTRGGTELFFHEKCVKEMGAL